MKNLTEKKRQNEERRRFLYLKARAYARKLEKDIDPDSEEWLATFEKLRALDEEMDALFLEMLAIKHEESARFWS